MTSPQHLLYQKNCQEALRELAQDPNHRAAIDTFGGALALLFALDLEPARPFLMEGYAPSSRGGRPWDPLLLLRSLILAPLVGFPDLHDWVDQLRLSPVLRAFCGFPLHPPKTPEEDRERPQGGKALSPGVGTYYDFFHRLHDGALRRHCPHQTPPSEQERARARTPRLPQRKKDTRSPGDEAPPEPKGEKKRAPKKTLPSETSEAQKVRETVTGKLLKLLRSQRHLQNPHDFLQRLWRLFHAVALSVSADKGLLGEVSSLIVSGDGSPFSTAANSQGIRICACNPRTSCDCPRRFSDPDARLGWDSYRKCYYFGYNGYEISTFVEHRDLPLCPLFWPANETDPTAAMKTWEFFLKELREVEPNWRVSIGIADKGHDGLAQHEFLRDWEIQPVIPLRGEAPAVHPERDEIRLSPRGIPLCQAGVEMSSWGTAGKDKTVFVCPVKAHKRESCPLAPKETPDWRCEEGQLAPTVNCNAKDNPRLFPEIARNSAKYEKLYARRSSCERSNSRKKQGLELERCRHRRQSFWQIRVMLAAILQHAQVWVSEIDVRAFVRGVLGESPPGEVKQAA